jgi:hypothetical protein
MKMTAFWDAAPCSWVEVIDVSEEPADTITIRAMSEEQHARRRFVLKSQ